MSKPLTAPAGSSSPAADKAEAAVVAGAAEARPHVLRAVSPASSPTAATRPAAAHPAAVVASAPLPPLHGPAGAAAVAGSCYSALQFADGKLALRASQKLWLGDTTAVKARLAAGDDRTAEGAAPAGAGRPPSLTRARLVPPPLPPPSPPWPAVRSVHRRLALAGAAGAGEDKTVRAAARAARLRPRAPQRHLRGHQDHAVPEAAPAAGRPHRAQRQGGAARAHARAGPRLRRHRRAGPARAFV